MDWVDAFYSRTGEWWGTAESRISAEDHHRTATVVDAIGSTGSLLELGCGYGRTAVACAAAGLQVVAIDLSDRIRAALADASSNPRFVHGDFYTADVGGPFDAVAYWDGFGVGTDDDQRRLLTRISDAWLEPGGIAIVDIFDPAWWSGQAGFEETKPARPGAGYHHTLGHRRDFDLGRSRALDSWWEQGSDEVITQSIRCYRPDELTTLTAGTDMSIQEVGRADGLSPTYRVHFLRR